MVRQALTLEPESKALAKVARTISKHRARQRERAAAARKRMAKAMFGSS